MKETSEKEAAATKGKGKTRKNKESEAKKERRGGQSFSSLPVSVISFGFSTPW